MITMQRILNQMAGKEIYDSLILFMKEEFEDFAAAWKQFEHTMDILQTELDEMTVMDAMDAVRCQTVSNLLFCGFLGLKANLDNFINPLSRNFLDVDSEVYLREDTAHSLPEYKHAQQVLDRFYSMLSPNQKVLHDDIIEYICHLENTVPKLAHYYGYILGNELFPRIIPGYHTDKVLTIQYRMMLRNYFKRNDML